MLKKGCAREITSFRVQNETCKMCIDFHAINMITVKFRFSIPCLDNMLNFLHGARMFLDHSP